MSDNALELRHVSRCLGDFELRDVNLTLPKGCILGLVGENGAGKSTPSAFSPGSCGRTAARSRCWTQSPAARTSAP